VARAFVSHQVTEYEKWRPSFDRHMSRLTDVGVTLVAVFRDTDNPNAVLVCLDSDRLVGEAILQDPEIESIMREAGAITPFNVSWVD
jgi:hypothetical protein